MMKLTNTVLVDFTLYVVFICFDKVYCTIPFPTEPPMIPKSKTTAKAVAAGSF